MLLNLSQQENDRLYKLAQDKATIEALKKMFLNHYLNGPHDRIETDGASYIAITFLEAAFKHLSTLQPKEDITNNNSNIV